MESNSFSFNEIPGNFLAKWQEFADLIAAIMNIPAALIMKTEDEFMEVFISSNTENNPYHVGDKEKWCGLYCETVIKSQKKLLIPNALKDKDWDKNPYLKLGMVAYLGFPINFPDNQPFGTICILDNKDNTFLPVHEKLMIHFKEVIESDLAQMQIKTNDLSHTISEQQSQLLKKNIELNTAKEKAEETEAKYRLLFDSNPQPMLVYDIETLSILAVNGTLIEKYGYTEEEFLSMTIKDIRPQEDIEKLLDNIKKIDGGLDEAGEWKHRLKNGTIIDVNITSHVIHYEGRKAEIVIAIDITERKRAEEALYKSNKRLESLLEISRKITSTIDQDMIMQMIVDNAIKLVGLDTGAVYLKSDDETIRLSATTPALPNNFPDDLRNTYLKNHPHLNKALRTGKYVLMEDALSAKLTSEEKKIVDLRKLRTNIYQPIVIRKKTVGAFILSSIETTRIFTNDDLKMLQAFANQAAHIIDNVKNYTSLKKHTIELEQQIKQREKAEQGLIIAKEKAEESDRLKSAFLANMSHEIRTPMNGILGFADLLKKPDLKGENRQKYIGIIERSGKRMLNIINDIVDISKIEAGLIELDMKDTNVNEQIEDIFTFFKPEVEAKGMKLSFKNAMPAKEAIIKTDREKVYAILANLVKNAIKYTEEGSIDLGYNLKADTKPGELEFYVKDTGIGIPKDRQEAIFDRFIQADIANKMAHQGAGLGLAITKAYVEMLGGKIRVESKEGKGSTFYFTLPYNTQQAAETIDQELESI